MRTGSRFEEDSDDESEGDVFVFPYGVVVCWGLTKEQEQELLVVLRFVAVEPVDEIEEDEFTYTYGEFAKDGPHSFCCHQPVGLLTYFPPSRAQAPASISSSPRTSSSS